MSASMITTRRSAGQVRAMLARIAQPAIQIDACYRAIRARRAVGFADPAGWKCSPRYGAPHQGCPAAVGCERPAPAQAEPAAPGWCNGVMFRRVLAILVLVLVAVVAIRLAVGLVVGLVSAVLWIVVVAALVVGALWARSTLKSAKKRRGVKSPSSPELTRASRWRSRCAASPSSCASRAAADGRAGFSA